MAGKDVRRRLKQEAKQARREAKAARRLERRKAQAILPRREIADQLRALANQIEGGTFVLGDKQVALPESAEFEISYKFRRKGGHQIEVELEWGSIVGTPLLPTH